MARTVSKASQPFQRKTFDAQSALHGVNPILFLLKWAQFTPDCADLLVNDL